MNMRALYLTSCDLQTTFSSYMEQKLTNGTIRRKITDYGQPHDTELSSIIIRTDIVLRVQLSSKLASIACRIFNVMIIMEWRLSLTFTTIAKNYFSVKPTITWAIIIVGNCFYFYETNWDISVGIATGYRLEGRGSILGRDKRFFPIPHCPDRLWGPPSLLSNG
jgi:hypothetical protein